MVKKITELKSDVVYNHWENLVYVKTDGDMIYVICDTKKQVDTVNERFYGTGNILVEYEELEKDDRTKYIVTYKVPVDGEEIVYN